MEIFLRSDRSALPSLIIVLLFAVSEICAFATASVTLAWNPSPTAGIVGYKLYYGASSGVYTNQISVPHATIATISGLIPGATYYFAVMAYDGSGLESPFSNEAVYTVPLAAVSPSPTLNPISNFYLTENAAVQTVSLTGISPGAASKKSTVKITAVSSNRKLLPTPVIRYYAGAVASMTFKPARNVTGTTTITVTVNNRAKKNNLVKQTFTVTVL